MHYVEAWLGTLPPEAIYLLVSVVIGLESMGVPLPGEITLVSAALLASTGVTSPWGVALAAGIGAIVGDSIGYAIGRRGGRALLERLGRRFPRHLGPAHLSRAEHMFARWGVWAVFFGRFVALLRILAGPLAGALHVPYRKFLLANASGGVVWAFGTTYLLFYVGRAAERWLKDLSWAALGVAVLCGVVSSIWLKRRARYAASAEHGKVPSAADGGRGAEDGCDTVEGHITTDDLVPVDSIISVDSAVSADSTVSVDDPVSVESTVSVDDAVPAESTEAMPARNASAGTSSSARGVSAGW